jgi:tight adherence protein B
MTAILIAAMAAYGVHLLYTARMLRWSGIAPGPTDPTNKRSRRSAADWMTQAGLGSVGIGEFTLALGAMFLLGALGALALFGAVVPMVAAGIFAASFPVAAYRQRRRMRLTIAQDSWPRMIEELRLLTSSIGRSLPQALFEVGGAGPEAMRPAFEAAHREWMLTTNFERTLHVLREQLADPTCDATCETLLIAHELGGTGIDRRLADLAQDRRDDVTYRKDVRARQSGVRFARRFVLLVPLGMAAAGLAVGNGRSAYTTPIGQVAVLSALAIMAACWRWAGHMLQLPTEERVFVK